MNCKNCDHKLNVDIETPQEGEKGVAYFYTHKEDRFDEPHEEYCNCEKPEPPVKCDRHKWDWIVSGYAKKCLVCGIKKYFYERIRSKEIQLMQGGFPVRR